MVSKRAGPVWTLGLLNGVVYFAITFPLPRKGIPTPHDPGVWCSIYRPSVLRRGSPCNYTAHKGFWERLFSFWFRTLMVLNLSESTKQHWQVGRELGHQGHHRHDAMRNYTLSHIITTFYTAITYHRALSREKITLSQQLQALVNCNVHATEREDIWISPPPCPDKLHT